ncbi:hypothetical protein BJ170DRAFT_615491 [Xylariales sp. AK1849]|nr:hypothetical protein BJ170DRAFT_615491 [Xylariales sp. AK1849]
MATELGRVASAVLRSAPSFGSPSRLQPRSLIATASSSSRQSSSACLISSLRSLSINGANPQQKRHQSTWSSPSRAARLSYSEDANITRPGRPTAAAATSGSSVSSSSSPSAINLPDPDSDLPDPRPSTVFDDLGDDDYDFTRTFKKGDLAKWAAYDGHDGQRTIKYPEIRCVPRTGRTINVTRGADVARSFKILNMQCAMNRVRQDFQYQRYHERAGLKRKRLKSERWQRRFKKGFKATCKRVDELRRQGW